MVALSIATRCDCLPPDVLDLLDELNRRKPVWIELGLQTIHDKTLHAIRSGFTLSQFEQAVSDLHKRNIPVITHLILGLPGETKEDMLSSVRYVGSLPVTGIKLQLLHILKGTDLGTAYMADPFPLFTLEEYCDLIADCIALAAAGDRHPPAHRGRAEESFTCTLMEHRQKKSFKYDPEMPA